MPESEPPTKSDKLPDAPPEDGPVETRTEPEELLVLDPVPIMRLPLSPEVEFPD